MQPYTIFFIIVNAVQVSGGFSVRHQELKNCTHSTWYVPGLLAATATDSVVVLELNHASGSSKQAWHIPDAVCTVLSSSITKGLDATGIHRHPENVTMEIIHDGHSKERSGNCITNAGFLSLESIVIPLSPTGIKKLFTPNR